MSGERCRDCGMWPVRDAHMCTAKAERLRTDQMIVDTAECRRIDAFLRLRRIHKMVEDQIRRDTIMRRLERLLRSM